MAKRFDIVTPRKGRDGKTFWTKIGVAFENKTGGCRWSFDARVSVRHGPRTVEHGPRHLRCWRAVMRFLRLARSLL